MTLPGIQDSICVSRKCASNRLYPSYGHAKSVAGKGISRSPWPKPLRVQSVIVSTHRASRPKRPPPLAGDSVSALLSHTARAHTARAAALARLREPFVHAIDIAGHHGLRRRRPAAAGWMCADRAPMWLSAKRVRLRAHRRRRGGTAVGLDPIRSRACGLICRAVP